MRRIVVPRGYTEFVGREREIVGGLIDVVVVYKVEPPGPLAGRSRTSST
jgi:hypothetical protein